jgi:hypothetical protein
MITRAVIVVAMAALVAAFLVEPGSANDVTVKDGDTNAMWARGAGAIGAIHRRARSSMRRQRP